ncbi:hypothetical protein SAMN04487898_117142 [Pedobacter sp. ok626]|uniref:hypothetical protein n=1 Tax=Pedobacter sp. ok626 TaxID=1761882 RepID=UPI0008846725|nr:hypothetical protein [Pedobacter sp. ok626]SDL35089.1 hypothetical protein SAMN04487898_117142 [Pedobacter sp. ok626]
MKKNIRTALGVMLFSLSASSLKAQNMETSLNMAYKELQSATKVSTMVEASNKFSMIAFKWPKEWATNYYAAYANAYTAIKEPDIKRKDQFLDQAENYLNILNSLGSPNDESLVLTAYVGFSRFLVDPANRWKKYLDVMNANLEKAKKINPDNPRIYYLQGIPLFNRPVLYGGGKKKAKPYFEKAQLLFAKKQNSTSILSPYWGEKDNQDYLLKCDN